MKKMLKYIVWLAKFLVVGLCVWYLGKIGVQIDFVRLRWSYIFTAVAASVFCFLCTFILVWNWRRILWLLEGKKQRLSVCVEVYFKAALAKYIPSNVMHYASRHYYGKRFNICHKTIWGGNLLEITLLVVSVFLMVWVAVAFDLIEIPAQMEKYFGHMNQVLFFLAGVCILLLAGRVWVKARKDSRLSNREIMTALITIAINYVLFFSLSSMILLYFFWHMDLVVFDISTGLKFVALYSCAWLGGFVTPGAPGGIGVRESIMVILLGDMIDQQDALVGVLLFRFATVLGELIAYGYANYFLANIKNPKISTDVG